MECLFQFAAAHAMLPREGVVLCAVSGGADSMYLLANLAQKQKELGYRLFAAHFDHKLRVTSQRDAQFVADWCRCHHIPCTQGEGNVAEAAKTEGKGIEETARKLRYAFLQKTAEEVGADVIATAHTADDNGETLLMNLIRGTGADGMGGIPPRRGNIVRPLLTTTREEIEAWLTVNGVPHVEDESNADEEYTRNFLRRQVMPLLKQVNPRAVEHMTAAAARLRRDNDLLNGLAEELLNKVREEKDGWTIPVNALNEAEAPVALRAVGMLLRMAGGEQLTSVHRESVLRLARGNDPSARVSLPGVTARRVYGELRFTPCGGEEKAPEECVLPSQGDIRWGRWLISLSAECCSGEQVSDPQEFWLSAKGLAGRLTVRSRREGDRLKPVGRPCKSVKKWFIDEKVPRLERDAVPVLWDGARVAAVGGIGPEESLLAGVGEAALHVILKQEGAGAYEC